MSEMSREDVERLVRIESKLDEALQRAGEDRGDHDKDVRELRTEMDTTEKRVGTLENWRYAVGGALVISLGSAAASVINAVPK